MNIIQKSVFLYKILRNTKLMSRAKGARKKIDGHKKVNHNFFLTFNGYKWPTKVSMVINDHLKSLIVKWEIWDSISASTKNQLKS